MDTERQHHQQRSFDADRHAERVTERSSSTERIQAALSVAEQSRATQRAGAEAEAQTQREQRNAMLAQELAHEREAVAKEASMRRSADEQLARLHQRVQNAEGKTAEAAALLEDAVRAAVDAHAQSHRKEQESSSLRNQVTNAQDYLKSMQSTNKALEEEVLRLRASAGYSAAVTQQHPVHSLSRNRDRTSSPRVISPPYQPGAPSNGPEQPCSGGHSPPSASPGFAKAYHHRAGARQAEKSVLPMKGRLQDDAVLYPVSQPSAFSRMDANDDGVITRDEFAAATAAGVRGSPPRRGSLYAGTVAM